MLVDKRVQLRVGFPTDRAPIRLTLTQSRDATIITILVDHVRALVKVKRVRGALGAHRLVAYDASAQGRRTHNSRHDQGLSCMNAPEHLQPTRA